jgi:hypothetical protein
MEAGKTEMSAQEKESVKQKMIKQVPFSLLISADWVLTAS